MARRYFNSHIKSLVHFDYPYYGQSDDGCRDEINGNIYSRHGSVKFVGYESPCDEIVEGTPRFGYRCLQSASSDDYITAKIETSLAECTIECYARPTASTEGKIIEFFKNGVSVYVLKKDSSNAIQSIATTSAKIGIVTLNTWNYICVNVSGIGDIDEVRIGGFVGQVDEFILWDKTVSSASRMEPLQGSLNIQEMGGYGTGITDAHLTASQVINSYAPIVSVTETGTNLTFGTISEGKLAKFAVGTEILIHVSTKKAEAEEDLGKYAFRKITAMYGGQYVIDSPVTQEFNLSTALSNYNIQAIAIPHLNTLIIDSSVDITPLAYSDSTGGGIVGVRVKGNMSVNGRILTSGYGMVDANSIQMTHSELPDRFLCSKGGGIFIVCGGTFSAGENARLGASCDGSKGAGEAEGGDGGAGYGGGTLTSYYKNSSGGIQAKTGYVGFGGEVWANYSGGAPGHNGNSLKGGAGGGYGGASVMLIAEKISLSESALSTGGQGAKAVNQRASYVTGTKVVTPYVSDSGGGTGFAYIACKEAV